MGANRWLRALAAAMGVTMLMAGALAGCGFGGSGSGSGDPARGDADAEVGHTWRRAGAASGRAARENREIPFEPGDTGRFTMRIRRGVVGVTELDATLRGSFDNRVPASELVIDLVAMAAPVRHDGGDEWPPGSFSELTVRRVGEHLFVHTGREPLPWVVFGDGADPLGAREMAATHDPARLLSLLQQWSAEVVAADGGTHDGVDTIRYSGWLVGAAIAELDRDGGAAGRYTAIGGVGSDELLDRLFRFDVWAGVDDGVPRRLVVEWDLEVLAELAWRLDGSDHGIDRLIHRTEVDWFDIGRPITIEAPPRELVGVIDAATREP
jgi:hypothetical protein